MPPCSMKHTLTADITRHFWFVLLVPLLAFTFGCGDESATEPQTTTPPPPSPMEVPSGSFAVTSGIIFDSCSSTTTYDQTYNVQIDDTGFSMGNDWTGTWTSTPTELKCNGESVHDREDIRDCSTTTFTTVELKFSSPDEFSGTIVFFKNAVGPCTTRENCRTTWRINGTRQ